MVLSGILLFTLGVYLIGNNQSIFTKTYRISSIFKNVKGLRLGNNVRYLGINAGNVETIDIINDTTIRVTMKMDIKTKAYIKKNAIAKISSDGLVGDMIVNIEPGIGSGENIDDNDEIKTFTPIATDEMLSTLSETNENAALLTAGILQITNSINDGKGTLGMLVNDKEMANDVRQIIKNLKETTSKSSILIKNLEEVSSLIKSDKNLMGIVLHDTIAASKVRNLVNNLSYSGDELKTMLETLNTLTSDLAKGDNSIINTLTNDSLLKNDLKETLHNINSGSQKFDENMEALKQHPLLRGYFKDKKRKEK